MKTQLITLFLLLATIANAQFYEVTPNGLRSNEDNEKTYLVIQVEGKNASELYNNALKYVNETYKNPDKVLKGNTENEYIRINTYEPNFGTVNNSGAKLTTNASYSIEIRFKDGKTRIEISQLEILADNGGRPVTFTGSIWKGYPIYNKNNEVRLPDTKKQIEDYFNIRLTELTSFLKGEASNNDDW